MSIYKLAITILYIEWIYTYILIIERVRSSLLVEPIYKLDRVNIHIGSTSN